MKPPNPRLHRGIYYWPTLAAAHAYAQSVGVRLSADRYVWPHAVPFDRGWAIQIQQSGPYLGPAHVKLSTETGRT